MESFYSIDRMVKERQQKYLEEARISRMVAVNQAPKRKRTVLAELKSKLILWGSIYRIDLQKALRLWLHQGKQVWR